MTDKDIKFMIDEINRTAESSFNEGYKKGFSDGAERVKHCISLLLTGALDNCTLREILLAEKEGK